MNTDLEDFVGRTSVFVEDGDACIGVVDSIQILDDRITACFRLVPDSFRCRLRRICESRHDSPIECELAEPPFGRSWDISVSTKEFFTDHDHWHASFLYGGGFRVFFQNEYVLRFQAADVRWLDEFYDDDDPET